MSLKVRALFVGKLKEPFAAKGCSHYEEKMKRLVRLEPLIIRDAPAKLPPEEKKRAEGEAILAALTPRDFVIALDENGRECTSRELAGLLRRWCEDPGRTPCLLVGGAFGLSEEVLARADFTLCLGRLTWPHELCRVMVLEQLYRAASIDAGLPYHHD